MKFAVSGRLASIFLAFEEILSKGYMQHMPIEEKKTTKPIKTENKKEDKSIENKKATIPETTEANSINPM
jgi:D-mannonate dehydratase